MSAKLIPGNPYNSTQTPTTLGTTWSVKGLCALLCGCIMPAIVCTIEQFTGTVRNCNISSGDFVVYSFTIGLLVAILGGANLFSTSIGIRVLAAIGAVCLFICLNFFLLVILLLTFGAVRS